MKNLTPYKDDCFEIHKAAVNKKQSGDLKLRLLGLNSPVAVVYNIFLQRFASNELSKLVPDSTLAKSKDDLLTLYSYRSAVIKKVRRCIRDLQISTIITTCQNCTIDTVNTLDHLLPKSSYPEFIVNPKNLFPCCSTCNTYKLDAIAQNNTQKFLNLYLDALPQEQYLFITTFLDNKNEFDFKFHLQNLDDKIKSDLFSIIESHYEKLQLCERMKLKSIEYISELENRIRSFKNELAVDEIVKSIGNSIIEEKKAYGFNHWKCILENTLINDPIFMDRFN